MVRGFLQLLPVGILSVLCACESGAPASGACIGYPLDGTITSPDVSAILAASPGARAHFHATGDLKALTDLAIKLGVGMPGLSFSDPAWGPLEAAVARELLDLAPVMGADLSSLPDPSPGQAGDGSVNFWYYWPYQPGPFGQRSISVEVERGTILYIGVSGVMRIPPTLPPCAREGAIDWPPLLIGLTATDSFGRSITLDEEMIVREGEQGWLWCYEGNTDCDLPGPPTLRWATELTVDEGKWSPVSVLVDLITLEILTARITNDEQ